MGSVFISFIHEEEREAECVQSFIVAVLHLQDRPFMSSDRWKIYAGELWLGRIIDELSKAVVILMLSPRSVNRPWVNFEAGMGWGLKAAVIPVCHGDLKKEELPKPYSNLQAIELQTPGDQYYLATSVAHYLKVPTPPPPPFQLDPSSHLLEPYVELRRCLERARSRPPEPLGGTP